MVAASVMDDFQKSVVVLVEDVVPSQRTTMGCWR